MPIDFNRQLIFDPKIDIIGKEVPLAEIEKTGNVLQDRYDKSYEQYSMADEALKNLEASAHEVDRQKARELRTAYKEEMDKVFEKQDFHNMRHQTAGLARNAAMNYRTLAERNAEIQKNLTQIANSPKYRLDPEGAKQDYLKNYLKPISINSQDRTVSDFNVTPYDAAADVNFLEKAVTYGSHMKPIINSIKSGTTVPLDVNMKPIEKDAKGNYDLTKVAVWKRTNTNGTSTILSKNEITSALKSALGTDGDIQAVLARQSRRTGMNENDVFNEEVFPAMLGAADLLRQQATVTGDAESFVNNPKYGNGEDDKKKLESVPTTGLETTVPVKPLGLTNTAEDQSVYVKNGKIKINENSIQTIEDLKSFKKNILPFQNIPYLGSLIGNASMYVVNTLGHIASVLTPNKELDIFGNAAIFNNPGIKNAFNKLYQNPEFKNAYKNGNKPLANQMFANEINKYIQAVNPGLWESPPPTKEGVAETEAVVQTFFGSGNNRRVGLANGLKIIDQSGKVKTFTDYIDENVKGDDLNNKINESVQFVGTNRVHSKNSPSPYDYGSTRWRVTNKDGKTEDITVEPLITDKASPEYYENKVYQSMYTPGWNDFKWTHPQYGELDLRSMADYSKMRIDENGQKQPTFVVQMKDGNKGWVPFQEL